MGYQYILKVQIAISRLELCSATDLIWLTKTPRILAFFVKAVFSAFSYYDSIAKNLNE